MSANKGARQYRMRDRAASTEATRQRILDATLKLMLERWYDEISLREIAAAAGVALQTVVNHFGSKDGILTATLDRPVPRELTRAAARPGDIPGSVRLLVEGYEQAGDAAIRLLALEDRIPAVRQPLDRGRDEHRKWVREAFPAALAALSGAARRRRLDLLVCATDVYSWKLLRRDRGLSQTLTATAISEMVEALHR